MHIDNISGIWVDAAPEAKTFITDEDLSRCLSRRLSFNKDTAVVSGAS
jgi:hypothetical protein